ncbi:MAG: YqgE/AlgH family protein, partial [Nitrospira sp.]|nr:YqgE/AlgH family protein [Nitrospira sp.]
KEEFFRAYLGYSGWGPGQLEGEMNAGSWILVPADPMWVFEKDASSIWHDMVLTLDDTYRPYAEMPFDPSCN